MVWWTLVATAQYWHKDRSSCPKKSGEKPEVNVFYNCGTNKKIESLKIQRKREVIAKQGENINMATKTKRGEMSAPSTYTRSQEAWAPPAPGTASLASAAPPPSPSGTPPSPPPHQSQPGIFLMTPMGGRSKWKFIFNFVRLTKKLVLWIRKKKTFFGKSLSRAQWPVSSIPPPPGGMGPLLTSTVDSVVMVKKWWKMAEIVQIERTDRNWSRSSLPSTDCPTPTMMHGRGHETQGKGGKHALMVQPIISKKVAACGAM